VAASGLPELTEHPQDTIEVLVTGDSARIRAVVPVREASEMPDT
jgi:hypothetical protein